MRHFVQLSAVFEDLSVANQPHIFCEGVNLTTCGGGQGSFGAYRSSELPSLPKDDIGESIHEKFRGFTAILGNLVATSISRGGRRHDFNCVRKET